MTTDVIIVQYRHCYVFILLYCICRCKRYCVIGRNCCYSCSGQCSVLVLIAMCSCIETFDYYFIEVCDLLLSLFILCSLDYYVYLDVLCGSLCVLFISLVCKK